MPGVAVGEAVEGGVGGGGEAFLVHGRQARGFEGGEEAAPCAGVGGLRVQVARAEALRLTHSVGQSRDDPRAQRRTFQNVERAEKFRGI